ncbi:MAG: RodZ domain-containing protein, partial [Thiogranum sp.]
VWIMVLALLALLIVYGAPLLERLWTSTGSSNGSPDDQLQLPQEHMQLPQQPVDASDESEQPALPESALPESALPEEQEPVEEKTEPGSGPAAQPPVEQTVEEKAQPEPATRQAAGPALIQMRFSEDSWVEMEARGRKLVVGTQYAGSERSVRAEPPIQILLGNAPGVELLYRGEVVDITPYQRGKVARLVLED